MQIDDSAQRAADRLLRDTANAERQRALDEETARMPIVRPSYSQERYAAEQAAKLGPPLDPEYARGFDYAKQQREIEQAIRDRAAHELREQALSFAAPRAGESVDEAVARLRERRAREFAHATKVTVERARARLAQFEEIEKDANRAAKREGKAHDAVKTESDKLAERAERAEAEVAQAQQRLADERGREAQLLEGGDADMVTAHAIAIGNLERAVGVHEKIAQAARAKATATLEPLAGRTEELRLARVAVSRARFDVAAERMILAVCEAAETIRQKVAPMVADADRACMDVLAAGADPGSMFDAIGLSRALLCAALEDA